jgi:thioredoxin:protein disulfide reductase
MKGAGAADASNIQEVTMKVVRLFLFVVVVGVLSSSALAQSGSAKVVKVSTGESVYKIKRGGSAQLAVIIKVDDEYHINSNRPAEKYLIPTALKIERMAGLTTTPVTYPKAKLQKFEFSQKPLSVFEGKSVLKLTARALPSLAPGSQTLKGKLTVQACNNQQCLRPQTIEVSIPLQVE